MAEDNRSAEANAAFGPHEFRKAMGRFASGVTVVTVDVGGDIHGMTAASFFSVSLHPPLIAVSVDKRAHMHGFLEKENSFGVSILAREQERISDHFAGRQGASADFTFVKECGIPLIAGALVHLCCSVEQRFPAGDHTIYLGRVEYLSFREDNEPLIFFGSRYHSLTNQNGGK